ncbi:type II toxin-antitoxin system VapC family toxin [Aquamicrobium sp. LC103]|uniref:type II toxin-antitoxin system VapC family toxin n=1 Tax=Aquamicrobium sp. LC103 TaxID=1120658 RepID=UPI00063E6CFD|nr:type II toxin-antitoxin system VapC family toxin [Aquamicrobium sp. LC103]TKT81135.1 type II toxin-antitoxin system VapC family toxin [Aquamicrobium sp. LC103]
MRLLLDTHVAIWAVNRPERIPAAIRHSIEDPSAEVRVSAVAVWEIAIKHQLRRPDAPPLSGHQAIIEFESAGFSLLDVNATHAAFVERLPLVHADPFDRVMLAQAIIENLQFVTFDRRLSRYDAAILTWP